MLEAASTVTGSRKTADCPTLSVAEGRVEESPLARDTAADEAAGQTVRVLQVINGEHYAGAERVQDLLAAELPALGFAVGMACVKPGAFPAMRACRQAPLHRVPMRGRLDLRPAAALARIIRGVQYRIVHAHTPRTLLLGALAARWAGVPLVYHVHSPTANDSTRPWQNRLNALCERVALREASAVMTVSASLYRRLRGLRGMEEKLSVVPNGVPARRPRPMRDPANPHWTLGTVALFRPRKGLEILLRAVAALKTGGDRVRLRAVGTFETESYRQEIFGLIAELGIGDLVDWVGFTTDVDRELRVMDLFVLPSLFGEGMPMVVLEAMAAGVPVVASRVEGIPEAIRDGRDGLLFKPGDHEDLVRALTLVTGGAVGWAWLRESALQHHAKHFSVSAMAAQVAAVYGRLLER